MTSKKIVVVILPLFILSFFANAQVIGVRLAANSGMLVSEFGPSDEPLDRFQFPTESTSHFTPQPTIGFEGEIIFQITPTTYFGIEIDYSNFKGFNNTPPLYNYFYTPYFQDFQDEFNNVPIKYNSHLWNIAVNYKYFFFKENVFQPFIKLTGVVAFVGTDLTYKDAPEGLDWEVLYARGTANSKQKKWPVFHVGGGLGFSYDLSNKMAFQVDGTMTVVNSGIVDGVPNFTYIKENDIDILRYNRRLTLTAQLSLGIVYYFEVESGGTGGGRTSPEFPFYRKKK